MSTRSRSELRPLQTVWRMTERPKEGSAENDGLTNEAIPNHPQMSVGSFTLSHDHSPSTNPQTASCAHISLITRALPRLKQADERNSLFPLRISPHFSAPLTRSTR